MREMVTKKTVCKANIVDVADVGHGESKNWGCRDDFGFFSSQVECANRG